MPLATAVGSIGTGLVGRLLGSGVQRLGSLAFQKVIRVVRIESALRNAGSKNPFVQTAVNDFEVVIGSRYGELNTQLFDFLREIERSAIVNAMVENALIERHSPELKRIFLELHERIIGKGNGDAGALFDQMMHSFSVTMRELSKDRIILDAFRLHRSDLGTRLDRVDAALVTLTSSTRSENMPFAVLQPILLRLAKGLQSIYRSIRVETNKGVDRSTLAKSTSPRSSNCAIQKKANKRLR
jgi:hypothetical protein